MGMTAYLSERTRTKRVAFKLNRLWNDCEKKLVHPWDFTIVDMHDVTEHRLVHGVRGFGACHGEELELPDGRSTMAVVSGESELTWDGDNLTITNDSQHCEGKVRTDTPLVMVRLFTPWLKDKSLPPWRILEQVGTGEFTEKPALGFKITGRWFGKRHDFPVPTGPKMHVACFGEVHWDSEHAYITS